MHTKGRNSKTMDCPPIDSGCSQSSFDPSGQYGICMYKDTTLVALLGMVNGGVLLC
jgi:hypothetical protein